MNSVKFVHYRHAARKAFTAWPGIGDACQSLAWYTRQGGGRNTRHSSSLSASPFRPRVPGQALPHGGLRQLLAVSAAAFDACNPVLKYSWYFLYYLAPSVKLAMLCWWPPQVLLLNDKGLALETTLLDHFPSNAEVWSYLLCTCWPALAWPAMFVNSHLFAISECC